jgi:hypothetical protein
MERRQFTREFKLEAVRHRWLKERDQVSAVMKEPRCLEPCAGSNRQMSGTVPTTRVEFCSGLISTARSQVDPLITETLLQLARLRVS